MSSLHFCFIQLNITKNDCCQLIQLLNITNKIPLCPKQQLENVLINEINKNNNNESISNILLPLLKTSTNTPLLFTRKGIGGPPLPVMNLKVESNNELPEEHLTFIFGIFMLISMVVICTLFLMKLVKVNSSSNNNNNINYSQFNPLTFAKNLSSKNYSLILCIPRNTNFNSSKANSLNNLNQRQKRRLQYNTQLPLVVLLDSSFKSQKIKKRSNNSNISIVSSNSMNQLIPQIKPSNSNTSELTLLNSSTSINNSFTNNLIQPPPCYEELME
ncbi:hypothetical protein Mgra_00002900 [Meloidogyne graminicola]|uniref:Uncharacterized protein n=1 Tax=Meloidogyne graminicola TaxID=189291 RepID=A0A8S9ZVB8_9BILA|nr:hypothetical protein Mgra_00002900 [Meloidogyne graminicola]